MCLQVPHPFGDRGPNLDWLVLAQWEAADDVLGHRGPQCAAGPRVQHTGGFFFPAMSAPRCSRPPCPRL